MNKALKSRKPPTVGSARAKVQSGCAAAAGGQRGSASAGEYTGAVPRDEGPVSASMKASTAGTASEQQERRKPDTEETKSSKLIPENSEDYYSAQRKQGGVDSGGASYSYSSSATSSSTSLYSADLLSSGTDGEAQHGVIPPEYMGKMAGEEEEDDLFRGGLNNIVSSIAQKKRR